MPDSFVHLHTHTDYSLLDGAARIPHIFAECARQGMPAVAATDHGNVYGALDFINQAESAGIKPIIGMEAYLAPQGRAERQLLPLRGVSKPTDYTHMTLWATSEVGLHNLFRLSSLAFLEGLYGKPRIDRELLAAHSEGVWGTTGCLGGEANQLLLQGFEREARESVGEMRDILKGNYFYEIMDHGIAEERAIHPTQIAIARDLNIPLIATNDAHYVTADQAGAHDALLCMQTGRTLSDPKRMRFDGGGYHLRSPQEMRELWKDYPEACDNTLLVAEACDVTLKHNPDLFPRFPVPEGHTEDSFLRDQVYKGLHEIMGTIPEEYTERLDYELGVITSKGYAGYFLIVADFIRWGKSQGIRFGPGRGSAAGVLCAYALGITGLDPIQHRLIFERFLNPDRPSLPDFDIDIDELRRGEVIEYVIKRYGSAQVAHIITYGTMKAKSAVKSAARVLDKPIPLAVKINKAFPPAIQGREADLGVAFDPKHSRYREAEDLRAIIEKDKDAREVVELAQQVEGLRSQTGVHAAGVIISNQPLIDHVPLALSREKQITTQFDGPMCESLGLLKMDFLGLRTLTILEAALVNIKHSRGVDLVLEDLPLDDPDTFRLYAAGNTLGVFQVDSADMRKLLMRMQPTEFTDISAVLALYRPGPMGAGAHNSYADRKNNREKISYLHPTLETALKPILEETYGVCVYQEQVIAIAQTLAGYSVGEADLLRKAMGKKKREVLDEIEPDFRSRCRANGYSDAAFDALWAMLVPFSDYAFNRAHTASYGVISYWTAYLKTHYTVEYMAALLSCNADKPETLAVYLAECRRMGIQVLPPDVNTSLITYSVDENNNIVMGLPGIKGVGAGPASSIIEARQQGGPFRSLSDLVFRTGLTAATINAMIPAGALDCFGHTRAGLLEGASPVIETFRAHHLEHKDGAVDLFSLLVDGDADVDVTDPPMPSAEWDALEMLNREYQAINIYLSGHPLDGWWRSIERSSSHPWLDIPSLSSGTKIITGGMITEFKSQVSKKGNPWVSFNLMGMDGGYSCRLFTAKVMQERSAVLHEGAIVLVKAEVMVEENTVTLKVDDLKAVTIPDSELPEVEPVVIEITPDYMTKGNADALRALLASHPGNASVKLLINGTLRDIPEQVRPNEALKRRIMTILGTSSVKSGFGDSKMP